MVPLILPENLGSTVDVSIIHAGRTIVPTAYVVKMPIAGHDVLDMPCYSFLIENKGLNKRVLFDLGLRKDWKEKLPLPILQQIESAKAYVEIKQDVACQLRNANVPLESINAIIWSHHHMDHTGDPSLFPPSTNLIVGPGFKHNNTTFPGYPANSEALVTEDAFIGRSLVELDFSDSMTIGDFLAIDFFQDGSLYLLKSNGHTHNHISALARTSKDRFIFLGADIAHHPGEYRPTRHLPLPIEIKPSPLDKIISSNSACPGSVFEAISSANFRGSNARVTPFYNLNAAMNENLEDAEIALEKLLQFDGSASVLVVTAHDASLLDVVPFFPRKITEWDVKEYKAEGTWRFLRDFAGAIDGTIDESI